MMEKIKDTQSSNRPLVLSHQAVKFETHISSGGGGHHGGGNHGGGGGHHGGGGHWPF